jgi:hypothetical protein
MKLHLAFMDRIIDREKVIFEERSIYEREGLMEMEKSGSAGEGT